MAITECQICYERLADLKRIGTYLPDIENPDDIFTEDAVAGFQQQMDSVLQRLNVTEDEDFNYVFSASIPDYMASYKHLKSISPALVKAYQSWYNIRQDLEKKGIIYKFDNEIINKRLQDIMRYL